MKATPMTMPAPPLDSLEATHDASEGLWKSFYGLPHDERVHFAKTRDFFLDLATLAPSSLFEDYKDHNFWKFWRSRNRDSTVLSMVVAQASDIGWVARLLSLPQLREQSSVVKGMASIASRRTDHVKTIKIFKDEGLWEPSSELLCRLSHAGLWDPVAYLLAQGDYPVRIDEVEDVWAVKRRRPATFPKNMTQKDAFAVMWGVWGEPSGAHKDKLLELSSDSGDRLWKDLYWNILEHYNGLTGWSPRAASIYIYNTLQNDPEDILKRCNEGWVFTEEAWTIARKKWVASRHPLLDAHREVEDSRYFDTFRSKCLLRVLQEGFNESPSKSFKL